MAKGFGVLLVLFGAFVCVHQHHEGVFIGEVGAHAYVNPANSYMKPAEPYIKDVVSARERVQEIYLAEVGVRELTGRNDGKRVAEYLRYTDLGEGYAWCASFVSWVYGQAGYPEPRTAWSPALFPAKRVIWRRGDEVRPPEPHSGARHLRISSAKPGTDDTNIKDRVSIPQKGDVFGIYFNSVKRIAHAGFVDEWGDKFVITVEGNTNEAGSREGDGVYKKRRLISSIYRVSSWF